MTKYPWETPQLPAATQSTTEETLRFLQKDIAHMVTHTAVLVHSSNPALQMLVNTARGQIIPRGECKFTDGTTLEFQDIGMPQPKTPYMSVQELIAKVWSVAAELGLELQQ